MQEKAEAEIFDLLVTHRCDKTIDLHPGYRDTGGKLS